ncbi:hypothetical protein RB213_015069 [Colletotrichum asianum]
MLGEGVRLNGMDMCVCVCDRARECAEASQMAAPLRPVVAGFAPLALCLGAEGHPSAEKRSAAQRRAGLWWSYPAMSSLRGGGRVVVIEG